MRPANDDYHNSLNLSLQGIAQADARGHLDVLENGGCVPIQSNDVSMVLIQQSAYCILGWHTF